MLLTLLYPYSLSVEQLQTFKGLLNIYQEVIPLSELQPLNQPLTTEAAIALQEKLRQQVVAVDDFDPDNLKWVAGVDVGFEADDKIACAAIAVLRFPQLVVQESLVIRQPTTFPYIPGLLAFREVPVVMEALAALKCQPDLLLCDGNGTLHPRRCGFACHLGIVSGIPSIGVAKTPFIGEHQPLDEHRGAWQPITDQGEVIGAVLRTQTNVNPVYVSVGHRISLATAINIVLQCAPKFRLPETTRQADQLSKGNASAIPLS
jgi:deoxyribonuclease V